MTKPTKKSTRFDPYKNFKFRAAIAIAAVASVVGVKRLINKQDKKT